MNFCARKATEGDVNFRLQPLEERERERKESTTERERERAIMREYVRAQRDRER